MTIDGSGESTDSLRKVLQDFYGNEHERMVNLMQRYGELYALPHLVSDWDVAEDFFAHSTRIVTFVVVALHNDKKEIFVVHTPVKLEGIEVGSRLLGSAIQTHRGETIESAADRIVASETGQQIAELQPIARLEQTFKSNGRSVVHHGIALLARAHGEIRCERYSDWEFRIGLPDGGLIFQNAKIFAIARDLLDRKFFDPPLDEIEAAKRSSIREVFHQYIFKPTTSHFASRLLKGRIKEYVSEVRPKSVLDLSAGDDQLILEIASDLRPDLCVANDIAWKQMAGLMSHARERHLNVLFTNHNLADLPLKVVFDVVICKNTLHHIRNTEEMLAVFRAMRRLGRRLIVVDVEDPSEGFGPKLMNFYYTRIYGDGGEHRFFTYDKFTKIIELGFEGAKLKTERCKTIKGYYSVAVVDVRA